MALTNAVVDLSHHNKHVDLATARNDGTVGVIHKASEGIDFNDSQYELRRQHALELGLLWGAYHFGTGEDPVAQAEHFLEITSPTAPDLLVALDFERNSTQHGTSMSLEQAQAFVTHVAKKIGRWPGLYSGRYLKNLPRAGNDPGPLSHCWLWLAEYGESAIVPGNWNSWTFWQYTNGKKGPEPRQVQGIGPCLRDKFNGDSDALRSFWTELHRTRFAAHASILDRNA